MLSGKVIKVTTILEIAELMAGAALLSTLS